MEKRNIAIAIRETKITGNPKMINKKRVKNIRMTFLDKRDASLVKLMRAIIPKFRERPRRSMDNNCCILER